MEVFAPIALLSVVARHELLSLFGAGFRIAAPALMILVLGQFVNYVTGPVGSLISMGGWSRIQLWNTAISLALQTIFAFLLIPSFGIKGAALANSVGVITNNLLQVVQVRRLMNIYPFSPALVKPFLATLAGFAVALLIGRSVPHYGLVRALLISSGLGTAYVAVLYSLGFDQHSRTAWRQVRYVMLPRLLNPVGALLGR